MTATRDLAKLPAWARDLIQHQAREIEILKEQAVKVDAGDTPISYVSMMDGPVHLPANVRVRFNLDGRHSIEAMLRPEREVTMMPPGQGERSNVEQMLDLHVVGGFHSRLVVLAEAVNSIRVTTRY